MLTGSTATLGRLTAPHREGHATPGPDFPLLERSQIVFNYVPAGVKVSIKGVTTMFADKVRLVNSVRTGNVSASAALLGGVAGVYIDHSYSLSLSFILYKLLELCKVPAVYPASVLLVGFNSLPDSLELFKDDYPASRNEANYLLCYPMVNSSPKPFLPPGKRLKVPFRRRSAFGLQSLAKRKVSFRNCSYVPAVKELVNLPVWSGSYRKVAKSQVNSNEKVNGFYVRKLLFNGNVEEKLFELFVIFEISRGNFPVQVLFKVIGNFYLELLPSLNSSKGNFLSIQPNSIGTLVVTDSRIIALRTPTFESFLLSLDCRLKTFGSHNPCGDYKLGRERSFVSKGVIGEFVELNPVPKFSTPTNFTSIVVGKLILLNGFKEYMLLFLGGFKNELESSLQFHVHILLQYLQTFKRSPTARRRGGEQTV